MCIQSFPSGTYRDKTLVLQPSSLGAHGRNSCTAITQHLEQLFPLNCKGTVRPEERGIIALVLSLGDTLSITWHQRPLSNSLPLLHKGQQESQGPHLFPNSRRRHQTKMLRQWLLTLPKLKRGMVQAPRAVSDGGRHWGRSCFQKDRSCTPVCGMVFGKPWALQTAVRQ